MLLVRSCIDCNNLISALQNETIKEIDTGVNSILSINVFYELQYYLT